MPGTRKLGRTSDHRTAMLRAMVTFLLENGKIERVLENGKLTYQNAENAFVKLEENYAYQQND